MSGQFKVGDICIFQHLENYPQFNGEECVIVGGLAFRAGLNRNCELLELESYEVSCRGDFGLVRPYQLRRKPPQADSGERTFMADIRKLADKAPQRMGETA